MPPPKKNQPAVNDPLEGVKLEKQGKSMEEAVVDQAAPTTPSPPAAAAVPAGKVKKYRVKTRTHVSHFGQLIVLNPDDILSADSYGDEGLKRLLESVPTEELP